MNKISFNDISACVFDFGNVLVSYDPMRLTLACIKNEEEARIVCPVVFDRLYWDALDAGIVSDDEVKEAFCKRLPDALCRQATEVYDRWIENLTVIDGMKNLIEKISASGRRLYILSNISQGFAEKYSSVPHINELLSVFDGLVFSGCIGITKPDKRIYRYLLDRFSLDAGRCVFIDDRQENVQAAISEGMKGILFDSGACGLESALF